MDILGTQYGPIWDSPGISITSLLMTHRWWCSLSCKHTFSLNPFYNLRTDRRSHFTEERMEDLRGWVTCWCLLNLKGRPRIWVQFVWQKVCGFRFVHLLTDAPGNLPLCDQWPLPALNHRLKKKKKKLQWSDEKQLSEITAKNAPQRPLWQMSYLQNDAKWQRPVTKATQSHDSIYRRHSDRQIRSRPGLAWGWGRTESQAHRYWAASGRDKRVPS